MSDMGVGEMEGRRRYREAKRYTTGLSLLSL